MEKIIECPFCDGHADLRVQEKEFLFKKEYFKVHEHYYKCGLCEEEFTTNEVDENTILQINNQYR
jgi:transcriptional regulator NrdR family protein